ncbi:MAG: peptidase M14 [Gemmatimonadetes bacterium]|nr:peptidase M14 [Gemmatimonadota bacterium]MYD26537.1 peptidase M14 [Gemmatimonadota bacterium]MYI98831.1 peptidase M14 [Gemmatimonadota bacterium]
MNRVHPRALSAVYLFAFGLICTLVPGNVRAQDLPFAMEVRVPGVESYDPAIPRPESVIGHTVGDTHTRSHLVAAYYRAVAEASDRVVVSRHGATYEGRHLYHAVVTSPANHGRLEEIRMANHQLSDAPGEVSDAMIETMPVVVHMGYGVHGNEASGPEAAMLVLYHLAAGSGPAVDGLLDRAVIILDPNYNPDGRDRFVNWVNANRGRVATRDGQDREHVEPWPGGRTNHYWFDLNRDWLVAQHPSSKGRVGLFHHWRAQVLTDVHEMGSNATYFFQPGIPSRNNPNTPERTFELTAALAEHHAEWLDRHGALYYSRETFDDFFYGKGSTFPDVNGAIGILFEQASSRALERVTNDGVLTFPFTIRNQVATSMSTLAGSLALRTELLTHQRDFYASALEAARRNPVKAYVLDLGGTRTRTQALLQMLLRHRIRVYELARTVQAGERTLPAGRTAGSGERSFRAGESVIIPMDQPQTRLIKASMEQVTTFTDSLFYDVSAWTLPLAMGVPSGELRSYSDDLAGAEITEAAFDGGELIGGHGSYAYLMEWDRYFAPRALYRLQDAGLRPRLARQPFSVAVDGPGVPGSTERTFDRGTIIIPVAQRDAASTVTAAQVRALIDRIVAEDHVIVHGTDTGLTPTGGDLGGPTSPVLVKPEIALLSGPGTRAYEVGETWHLLNERFGIPVSLVDADGFSDLDLDRYTTLVMVMGNYDLDTEDMNRLRWWVQEGGILIAWKSAARWLIGNEVIDEGLRFARPDSVDIPYELVSSTRGAQRIGGAIFAAALDTTHPLAFGYGDQAPLFRNHEIFFEPSATPGATVARYTSSPLLAGYISPKRHGELADSAALIARRQGAGAVVLFADNPNFRAFWYGTNGLFLNAVFFGGAF